MTRRLQFVLALVLCAGLTVLTFSPAQAQERNARQKANSPAQRVPASAQYTPDRQAAPILNGVPGTSGVGHDAVNGVYASFPFDDVTNVNEITSFSFGSLPGAGTISDVDSVGYFITGTRFYSLDAATGDSTFIADLNTPSGFSGMAYDESTDTYYGVTANFVSMPPAVGSLYEIDVSDGTASLIGELTGTNVLVGIATDDNGSLYGVDRDDDNLYQIDPATGTSTVVGPLGFDSNFDQGLTYDETSGSLYFAAINAGAGNVSEVRLIDLETGTATLVGTFANVRQFGWLGGQFQPVSGPAIGLTPDSLNFGMIAPGAGDSTRTIAISNGGDADLEVSDLSIGGMDPAPFSIADTATPITLSSGENVMVDVTFAPSALGDFEATLDVTSNTGGTAGTVTSVPLTGTGGTVNFGGPIAGYFYANNTAEAQNSSFQAPGVLDISIPADSATDVTSTFNGNDEAFVGPNPIGFDFQYFGQTYDSFCLYANGLVHLLNAGGSCPTSDDPNTNFFLNMAIPTADVPNNIIAFFWDDLAPGNGPSTAEALYGNDADGNLVVSFEDYGFFVGDSTNFVSADLMLYDDPDASVNDRIRMQYYAFGSSTDSTSATVGIENADGAEGIEYRFNDEGGPLQTADGDTLAVVFGPDQSTLPVELDGFTATASNGGVDLAWQTLSETANRGFSVEMKRTLASADGSSRPEASWQEVGFVESTAPGGTSVETQSYSLRVPELAFGQYTFRLRQVDLDGTDVLSGQTAEASIGLEGAYELSGAYPNPFGEQATIEIAVREAQEVTVEVYDVLGRRVMEVYDGVLEAGRAQTITVEARGLASGVYFYRVSGEDFTASRKMMIVR